jgi:hypothetical protein
VKRKDPKQPRAETTNSEPPVKRRKRSLPSDATTETEFGVADNPDNTLVEPVKHDKVTSIPVRRRTLRRNLAPSSSTEHATTPVELMSVDYSYDFSEHLPKESEQPSLQHNEDLHARQKRKISKLEAELVEQRAFTEQAQNQVKQDMLMDIMREKEKLKKTAEAAELAKRRHEKEVAEYKVKLEKAMEKSLVERTQTLNAQRAVESYRVETEHLQHFNTTLQSDLQELRVVEVEDRRARNDGRRDLPPAYGNLDDEDRFPPYSEQADAGSIELANLKREIRRKFERKIDEALAKSKKGSNTFCYLSAALEDVSQSLKTILDFAKDVPVSHAQAQNSEPITQQIQSPNVREQPIAMKEQLPSRPNPLAGALEVRNLQVSKRSRRRENNKTTKSTLTLIQTANAAPYVADRITKLLLELLWRTASACELRPSQRKLDAMFDHTLPVMHTSVDEVLVAALRLAFSKTHSLAAFQNYLIQIEILEKKFRTFEVGMTLGAHNALTHFDFFDKTLLWLNEQVEKERELRANETVEKMVRFEGLEDDDGVSSRWEGSDTAGSDDEDD